jgi:heme-degrading monooxygenase HmoA
MKQYPLSLLVGLLLSIVPQIAQCEPPAKDDYDPEPGDIVVVYRSEFKPEKFSEGVKALAAVLKKVVYEDPAVRDSYVLRDKKTFRMMGVVMWDSKKAYHEWQKSGKGKAIGEAIAEFIVKPTDIEEFELFMMDDE